MNTINTDKGTIAAIATGMGNAGIGVIRISGTECYKIVSRVFRNYRGETVDVSSYKSHTAHFGSVAAYKDKNIKETSTGTDGIIDQTLLLLMKAPHSYTGEDIAELQCHGGLYNLQQILQAVCDAGARLAEPGEFTKRAFLNGRMDLTQAEAVMDLIEAQNEFAHQNAKSQMEGRLGKKIREIRSEILYQMAYIESALDDPEHYTLDNYGEKLAGTVENLLANVEKLLQNADNGRIKKSGIRTVLVGIPNVGKSTLLNTLLGETRALVTQIPGTTRDLLEEQVRIKDLQLVLVDTAGIHDTENEIESMGIELTRRQIEKCDLVLFLTEAGCPLTKEEKEIISLLKNKKTIVLNTKSDLLRKKNESIQDGNCEDHCKAGQEKVLEIKELSEMSWPVLSISAKEETGIEELTREIRNNFMTGEIDWNAELLVTNIRHKEALKNTAESLRNVLESIHMQMPEDFYTIDLMDAYQELGMITGETAGEDLVNEIFSKFCTGK